MRARRTACCPPDCSSVFPPRRRPPPLPHERRSPRSPGGWRLCPARCAPWATPCRPYANGCRPGARPLPTCATPWRSVAARPAANACIAGWTAPARPTTRSTIFPRSLPCPTAWPRRTYPRFCSGGARHLCGWPTPSMWPPPNRPRGGRHAHTTARRAPLCANSTAPWPRLWPSWPDRCTRRMFRTSARPAGWSNCSRRSAWSRWRPPLPRTLPAA